MNKKLLAGILGAVLLGTFVAQQSFAVGTESYNYEIQILKIVKQIRSLLLDPNFGLAEIKREVRNIEGNITHPQYGLQEIKTEIIDIQVDIDQILQEIQNISGNGGQITAVFKDYESPFDVSNIIVIHIPEEMNGTLEEASCIIKDAGAWGDNGSLQLVVNIDQTEICDITATESATSFNDGINLALNGNEDITVSCTSTATDPDFQGCSVEIDLWMKLQNDTPP